MHDAHGFSQAPVEEPPRALPYRASHPSIPDSVPIVRHQLSQALQTAGVSEDDVYTAALLVSELASNAVQHAGKGQPDATISTAARLCDGILRVDVMDAACDACSMPQIPSMPADVAIQRERGRGLLLVETLARRWGCDRHVSHKSVWFELKVTA